MGRQIMEALKIVEAGSLNLKTEFGANHLCRLQSSESEWEREKSIKEEGREKKRIQENIQNFARIMSSIQTVQLSPANISTNNLSFSRYTKPDRKRSWHNTTAERKE